MSRTCRHNPESVQTRWPRRARRADLRSDRSYQRAYCRLALLPHSQGLEAFSAVLEVPRSDDLPVSEVPYLKPGPVERQSTVLSPSVGRLLASAMDAPVGHVGRMPGLAQQFEAAYRRLVADWQPKPKETVRARHRDAHLEAIN